MRRLLQVSGAAALAFLAFVGLLHAVLLARGRHTPEALGAFHDWPVLGGFFPKHVPPPEPPTPAQRRQDEATAWLADSRNEFRLPSPFTIGEIETLTRELKDSRTQADAARSRYEAELADLQRMKQEAEANRQALNGAADRLDEAARELKNDRIELDSERTFVREQEIKNFKTLAAMYEAMPADEAAKKLEPLDDGVVAMVVARMSERKAGRVLAAMETPRAVAITKKLQGLASADPPPGQKAR